MIRETESIRCAIYTRKSTSEGLEQEFNSLDAQRESAEAFIASHRHQGWECLPTEYADGGFSGGDMDRPGLKRLMADIEAGCIDCVVVYKVDRLSRSLLDFARMMQVFEKHGVSFVSVTQQFNTTHSMGRLTLNILLSFAQFEREMISERTRDKMAAARRKGKYAGGPPILGYDIINTKLVVNEVEALQIRQVFELYLEHEGLLPTIATIDQRGWMTKRWITKKGKTRGGRPFDKTSLHKLLTNVAYIGLVRHKEQIYEGEHESIVDAETFRRVQKLLRKNYRNGGRDVRNRFGALLKGLLNCGPCGCRMTPSHVVKNKTKRYRYYVCTNAQKRGYGECPSKSVPAGEIERFVVDQIRAIGRDPGLVAATLAASRAQSENAIEELETESRALSRELGRLGGEMEEAAVAELTARLADSQERAAAAERRQSEIRGELADLRCRIIDEADVRAALAQFDPVWDELSPQEKSKILKLLIERVDYDGQAGTISVAFHVTGIKTLAMEVVQ